MREDPFIGYLFRLTLGNIEIAGFSECSGLELETGVFEYQEGGLNTHKLKFPDLAGVKNLVLKRGITQSYELFDWYMNVAQGLFDHENQRPAASSAAGHSAEASTQDSSRRISIALVDTEGEVQKEWLVRRAFPVKWSGPEFSATANNVAFESIELAHEGLEKVVL